VQSGELILRKKGIFARKFGQCQLLVIFRQKKKKKQSHKVQVMKAGVCFIQFLEI
jgi:hypothetical protein